VKKIQKRNKDGQCFYAALLPSFTVLERQGNTPFPVPSGPFGPPFAREDGAGLPLPLPGTPTDDEGVLSPIG